MATTLKTIDSTAVDTFDSFFDEIASFSGATKTLFRASDVTLTDEEIIPANITVVLVNGAKFITGAYELHIAGIVQAPPVECFDTSGGGSVTWENTSQIILGEWEGATGVGLGTVRTPIQAVDISGNIELEDLTSSQTGIIYKGGRRFLSTYHSNGDAEAVANIFIGIDSGNLTVGDDATEAYHGSHNVGIGINSLQSLTNGDANVGVGSGAGIALTTGRWNCLIGHSAGASLVGGSQNTYVGLLAGAADVNGVGNVGIGRSCSQQATGSYNTSVGCISGTVFGLTENGEAITEMNNCIFIGTDARAKEDDGENEIVIGHASRGRGTRTAIIGNHYLTDIFLPPAVVAVNYTAGDGDGARAAGLVGKGTQSGGEETTLGYLAFAHDGVADDQKGKLLITLNDGDDTDSPSVNAMTILSDGKVGFGTASPPYQLCAYSGSANSPQFDFGESSGSRFQIAYDSATGCATLYSSKSATSTDINIGAINNSRLGINNATPATFIHATEPDGDLFFTLEAKSTSSAGLHFGQSGALARSTMEFDNAANRLSIDNVDGGGIISLTCEASGYERETGLFVCGGASNGSVGVGYEIYGAADPATAFEIVTGSPFITLTAVGAYYSEGSNPSRIIARAGFPAASEYILGYSEFSHSGAVEDQKGQFRIRLNSGADDLNLLVDHLQVLTDHVEIPSASAYQIGVGNGAWKFVLDGTDLKIQRYDTDTWVTKQTIAA